MRRIATALVVAACLPTTATRADDFGWPGRGTIRVTVPGGWTVSKEAGDPGYVILAQPRAGPTVLVQITLVALPPEKPMRAGEAKAALEKLVARYLSGSVERSFRPAPLSLSQGSGWFVQLTDASLVGKAPEPGNFKVMRNAVAALDDHLVMIATIGFDDPARPEVAEAMSFLSTVRLDRGVAGARPAVVEGGAFEFTVPQSQVKVKVPGMGLRRDADGDERPGYFKLSRKQPQLILSGWLEPASRYEGLAAFWKSETRSPAYAGKLAPTRVELLKVGPWEVVAFDVPLPGGTSAHLRAERVQAGTWIDLHLSTTSSRAPAALREELVKALRAIEVVEK